jgi:hypothetical protein
MDDDFDDFVEDHAAPNKPNKRANKNSDQNAWSEFEALLDEALRNRRHEADADMLTVIETVVIGTRRDGPSSVPARVIQKAAALAVDLGDAAPDWLDSVASIIFTPISFAHARRSLAINKLEVCLKLKVSKLQLTCTTSCRRCSF